MDMEWLIVSYADLHLKLSWSLQTLHIASDSILRWRLSSFYRSKWAGDEPLTSTAQALKARLLGTTNVLFCRAQEDLHFKRIRPPFPGV